MAQHGGQRSGAGRPKGGISQAKRVLNTAIMRGLAKAGAEVGLVGSEEEVATEAAANIVNQMIKAGRGDEVLKLAVVAAPKDDHDESGSKAKSPILAALSNLPGSGSKSAITVRETSRLIDTSTLTTDKTTTYTDKASDSESVGLVKDVQFLPQTPLDLVVIPEDLAGTHGQVGGREQAPPHPPLSVAVPSIGVDTDRFEKIENDFSDFENLDLEDGTEPELTPDPRLNEEKGGADGFEEYDHDLRN